MNNHLKCDISRSKYMPLLQPLGRSRTSPVCFSCCLMASRHVQMNPFLLRYPSERVEASPFPLAEKNTRNKLMVTFRVLPSSMSNRQRFVILAHSACCQQAIGTGRKQSSALQGRLMVQEGRRRRVGNCASVLTGARKSSLPCGPYLPFSDLHDGLFSSL